MVRLVVWDVDRTLVVAAGIERELFGRAFREVTGRPVRRPADVPEGATDAVRFRETAKAEGVEVAPGDFARFADVLAEQYKLRAPALHERGRALPGAAAALSGVASLPGVTQTAVAGSVRGGAEVRLRLFGLDTQLQWGVGAYGEDADDLTALLRLALERAGHAAGAGGRELAPSDVVLVGDAPADVEAGRAAGVRVVAVASGDSGEEALRSAGADAVLPGLDDTEELLKLLRAWADGE